MITDMRYFEPAVQLAINATVARLVRGRLNEATLRWVRRDIIEHYPQMIGDEVEVVAAVALATALSHHGLSLVTQVAHPETINEADRDGDGGTRNGQ